MSQGLKPCPGCWNQHPEITSGNRVICDECGESASYENWQKRRASLPYEDDDRDSSYWDARAMDEEEEDD